jgi:hypothetical protein
VRTSLQARLALLWSSVILLSYAGKGGDFVFALIIKTRSHRTKTAIPPEIHTKSSQ